MNDEYPASLEEIYTLIDKNRGDAARAAQVKFHNEMESAIAAIASIGSIAGARVLADSRVASANVLINAELAASRLLAEAEMQASKATSEILTKPRDVVEAVLFDIGKQTSLQLITSAKQSVEKIQQDAEAAIQTLRETGAIAIREIQALATSVTEQTKRDAGLAAAKLKEYRKSAHTPDEAASQGEDVATIVIQAAQDASVHLQDSIKKTMAQITTITDQACALVRDAALVAEKRIQASLEKALTRLKETLKAHL